MSLKQLEGVTLGITMLLRLAQKNQRLQSETHKK